MNKDNFNSIEEALEFIKSNGYIYLNYGGIDCDESYDRPYYIIWKDESMIPFMSLECRNFNEDNKIEIFSTAGMNLMDRFWNEEISIEQV